MKTLLATVGIVILASSQGALPALSQDSDAGRTLPDICTKDYASQMAGMSMATPPAGGTGMMDADQAHQDLMAGMGDMDKNMEQGMAAKDLDVAFVCGMIPHHQGAIDMARAELANGDDPWVKQLAQGVIAAQEKEIADMLDWLKKQSN